MRKVILFSPNGYVGKFIEERLQRENNIQLYGMARGSDVQQYKDDYDIMIYSAAITSSRNESPDKYVQDNVVTSLSIVDFCKKHHIKRIIYLSTDEVYGELNTDMVTDKTIMVNPNIYATTKYLAEKIIIESGIDYYILRLPGVVGRIWRKNFIYGLMDKISNNEQVELYNTSRKFNNIVDIDDLVDFIVLLCAGWKSAKNEIFLLGNSDKVELNKIVQYMKILYHSSSQIRSIDTDEKRYFTLDVSKAMEYGYVSKKIKTILDEIQCLEKKEMYEYGQYISP